MIRRTVQRFVIRDGPGIQSGRPAQVRIEPAPFGSGRVFHTEQGSIPAEWSGAIAVPGATVLVCGAARVGTVEHLLAALDGLEISDVAVHVSGTEVPALDGSAAGWVVALDEAGRRDGPALRRRPLPPVRVVGWGGEARADPEGNTLGVEVDFGEAGPRGTLEVPRTETAFRTEVAWARTFVLASQVDALRAAGRGAGATRENTVVWPASDLSSPDEPVRHKLLDLWGDLSLLGPVRGSVHVIRGSHSLHHALMAAIADGWQQ